MMKAENDSTRGERSGMNAKLMAALGLVLGLGVLPVQAQVVPADRLCTAGFNPDYGWFDVPGIDRFGVLEFPGLLNQSACVSITPAKLAVQLGGATLPLSGEATYTNLGSANPTLTVPLLEPALCEDYFSGSGTAVWNLVIRDANDQDMIGGPVVGITALDYNLASGALMPQRADASTPWLTCYSGLSPNAPAGVEGPGEDALFADGMESETSLRITFLDQLGNPLASDVLSQGQAIDSNVSFIVRVSNGGSVAAQDVRIREFVPTASTLMGPTVNRVACIDHGPGGGGSAACSNTGGNSNGVGSNRFAQNIGTLAAGAHRDFTLTRRSNSSDVSTGQAQALIQVAAFSAPSNAVEVNRADNSRSLRIRIVDQIQVTRGVNTNGTTGGSGGTISRVSAPAGCSAEATTTTTCPPATTGLIYSATAAGNYTFTGFTGCAGTTTGLTQTGGTFTTTGGVSCTVTANFRSMPTVTATAGANGSITPASQSVHYNTAAQFTVTPATGYMVDTISGCGGVSNVGGSTWATTNPVTYNCAVNVTFSVAQLTVTATSVGNGTVTPPSVNVQYGQAATFTATPASAEYEVVAVTGNCPSLPGGWFGNTYLITNITQNCQVEFEFALITHAVSVSTSMLNGNIVLDSGTVVHGQPAGFTVVPDTGYHLDGSVTGTPACGTINLTGSTGTTGPITSAGCELSADFAINQYTITVNVSGGNGGIAAVGSSSGDTVPVVIAPITHGTFAEVWVFPDSGYNAVFPVNPNCQFQYFGIDGGSGAVRYRALSVTSDCNVSVQFTL